MKIAFVALLAVLATQIGAISVQGQGGSNTQTSSDTNAVAKANADAGADANGVGDAIVKSIGSLFAPPPPKPKPEPELEMGGTELNFISGNRQRTHYGKCPSKSSPMKQPSWLDQYYK